MTTILSLRRLSPRQRQILDKHFSNDNDRLHLVTGYLQVSPREGHMRDQLDVMINGLMEPVDYVILPSSRSGVACGVIGWVVQRYLPDAGLIVGINPKVTVLE